MVEDRLIIEGSCCDEGHDRSSAPGPEIIRLSRVIEMLDRLCEHVLVHTGQNFDPT